jgi:hypothetical protein
MTRALRFTSQNASAMQFPKPLAPLERRELFKFRLKYSEEGKIKFFHLPSDDDNLASNVNFLRVGETRESWLETPVVRELMFSLAVRELMLSLVAPPVHSLGTTCCYIARSTVGVDDPLNTQGSKLGDSSDDALSNRSLSDRVNSAKLQHFLEGLEVGW